MEEMRANKAGLVVGFLVQPGETVAINQDVIMLESMKMYIPVQAPVSGIVRAIRVKEGNEIKEGDVILELE